MEGFTLVHSPTALTKNLCQLRNLSQVHSNWLFKQCHCLISASIVFHWSPSFPMSWGSGHHECWNARAPVPSSRDWAEMSLSSVASLMHFWKLIFFFFSNQFPNQFMMVYKPGSWFLLIVCQTLPCSIIPISLLADNKGTASAVGLYWLWSQKWMRQRSSLLS